MNQNKELIEKLAAIEHERWSDWQKYCHSKMIRVGDGMHSGKLAMDIGDESRWERQINTPYEKLTEKEKQSDRDQVMRYWPIIEEYVKTKPWPDINEMTIEKKRVNNLFTIEKLDLIPERRTVSGFEYGIQTKINDIIDYLRDQRL